MPTEDDPVIAEYDVYITPALQEQVYLLQFLNKARDKPYSDRNGTRPQSLRIKPKSGFLEMDIDMHAGINFNKYQSLKWGDALQTAKTLQNDSATYGPASGFTVPRVRTTNRGQLKDNVERENEIFDKLADFSSAQNEGKVLSTQTLGGKIIQHDRKTEAQPVYFMGAFRGNALHLSKVDGTVQMRPQFHHVDAEEQRGRVAASRAAAASDADATRPPPVARALQQSYKDLNDDKDKDAPERRMRKLLQDAEEEEWSGLQYVDEQEDLAYDTFNRCMFVQQPEAATTLKSDVDAEKYLDQVSLPPHETTPKRKKRPAKKKDAVELDDGD